MRDESWLTSMRNVLETYTDPALLLDQDYNVVLANGRYVQRFGSPSGQGDSKCYQLSHGYSRPCDEEGETCPMQTCRQRGSSASVLHIHNTPRGKEHVGIETTPVFAPGDRPFFIEVLKPIRQVSAEPSANRMIGRSPAFNEMVDLIQRAAPSQVSVLLIGPSGTGKELAAKALHEASQRADKPFVTVECSGLTDSLFESELFGHLRGAFTGASQNRVGLVESCNGGTLFLDEVGDIPLHLQVKLLRLIETRTYRPVGSSQIRAADFRLVCATHKNLPAMVAAGEFREDLFHRISTFPIRLPSLAARHEDLPLLVKSLLLAIEPEVPLRLDQAAMTLLAAQPFPGNIRELKNILQRAVVLRQGEVIDRAALERSLTLLVPEPAVMSQEFGLDELAAAGADLQQVEQVYIRHLLQRYADKSRVAAILGCSLRTLYRKLDRFDGR